jgi:hypothetical protein
LGYISDKQPISTTAGMREAKSSLDNLESYVNRPLRLGTITYFLAFLFVMLMVINALAWIYLLWGVLTI